MDRFHCEGRQANRDVFGAFRMRRAVLDPFAGAGDDGLAGEDFEDAVLVFHLQAAGEDEGVFVKLGGLAGLGPAAGAAHPGEAEPGLAVVHVADVFLDDLGLVAGGGDARRFGDELGHDGFF